MFRYLYVRFVVDNNVQLELDIDDREWNRERVEAKLTSLLKLCPLWRKGEIWKHERFGWRLVSFGWLKVNGNKVVVLVEFELQKWLQKCCSC